MKFAIAGSNPEKTIYLELFISRGQAQHAWVREVDAQGKFVSDVCIIDENGILVCTQRGSIARDSEGRTKVRTI